jgi:aryl-alcohol dehydrogenase-like predicted oxidoreductase
VFPADHIRASVAGMLRKLGGPPIDLVQFHVWQDAWADDEGWQRAAEDLRREGLARHVGISVNRREPANVLRTLRTGLIDSVQVVYNVFDQSPEDELFPLCRELGVAVIARVPLDEGSLAGGLTLDSRWPDGDWRNSYFGPAALAATIPRVEALRPLVPEGETLAQLALRFILSNPDVTTVIPGTRSLEHLAANVGAAAAGPLPADLLAALREHRWDRPSSRASLS